MMGRISREIMYLEMARVASRRSTCFRLNVGAILTYDNSPVSIGWNGARAGDAHCAGNECPGIVPGFCPTLHAEDNALNKASSLFDPGTKVKLYCTHSPCSTCIDLIMYGPLYVTDLFYEIPYRDPRPMERLGMSYPDKTSHPASNRRSTAVYQVTPAGYIVEHFTRKVVELP